MHGLRIECSTTFDALMAGDRCPVDVAVPETTTATIPDAPPPGRLLFHSPHDWPVFITEQDDGYRMRYSGHVDYHFSAALDRIECSISSEADRLFANAITYGAVLSALMTLRGLLSLHATSLDLHGHRIAVFGRSGQGKSTTAGNLMAAGATLVSDDVTVLDERFQTSPGLLGLRLRPDSSGIVATISDVITTESVDGRLVLRQIREPERGALPLRALFLPVRSTSIDRPTVERLRSETAIAQLLPAVRLVGWRDPAVLTREFHQLVAVAREVPVCLLHVPVETMLEDNAELLAAVITDQLRRFP